MSYPRIRLTRSTIAVAGQLTMFPDQPYRRGTPESAALPRAARRRAARPSPEAARPAATNPSLTRISALPRQRTGLPPEALTAAAASVPLILERTQAGLRLSSPALPGRYVGVRPRDPNGLGLAALGLLTEAETAGYSATRSGAHSTRRIPGHSNAPITGDTRWRLKHNPRDWAPPTDTEPCWTSPKGLKYAETTQMARRIRDRRLAAGITDPPPAGGPDAS